MPINLCTNCGRLTGYRTCPWCGGANNAVRQAPPFISSIQENEKTHPTITFTRRIRQLMSPFKAWRKAHREKVGLREALRAIELQRKEQHGRV